VDDGITLIMALKQPQIEIVGIINTYVDYSYDVINKILNGIIKAPQFLSIKDHQADDLGVENDGLCIV
jgi:pyrimidine-specific ribonucleoside hydrolase